MEGTPDGRIPPKRVIEDHDREIANLRMLSGRAPTPRPAVRPLEGEAPEGVAQYVCTQVVMPADPRHAPHLCGKTLEQTPYDPIPYHCDMPMTIAGYDWGRDVAT